jgi:hypothetical protein
LDFLRERDDAKISGDVIIGDVAIDVIMAADINSGDIANGGQGDQALRSV